MQCSLLQRLLSNSYLKSKVYLCDFHIFTVIYSSLHGFIMNQHNDQLPIGFLAQLVEHCFGVAEVMDSNPIKAFFQALFSLLLKQCSLLQRSLSNSRIPLLQIKVIIGRSFRQLCKSITLTEKLFFCHFSNLSKLT